MQEKFYGWKIVVFCGLIYALVGALGFTVGQLTLSYMMLDPSVTMNRTYLGLGFTLFVLAQGLPGPLIGQLVARKGARFAYFIGASLTAVTATLLALFLGQSVAFYLVGFGIVLSLGCMTSGQIPAQTTLTKWFVKSRGKAISFMMTMAALIAIAYPLITNYLIVTSGTWRAGFWFIAVCALVGLAIAVAFVKNKPEDINQLPDGDHTEAAEKKNARPLKVYQAKEHKTAGQALRTPAFWFIVFTAFTCFAALNLNISSGALHFVAFGISLDMVSVALSIKAVGGVIALLICSQLLDRIEPIRIHGIATLIMGVCALFAAFIGNPVLMMIYYFVVGFGYACQTACLPTELANLFGNTNYPKIMGWVLPIVAITASSVPTLAGMSFDFLGSYTPAFIGLFILGILGFTSSCFVRIPKVPKIEPPHDESTPLGTPESACEKA